MLLDNFQFFALRYLNDWCADDQRFVADLSPNNDLATRLSSLCEAATYYKVARTLPTLPGERRLAQALDAIDAVPAPITDSSVDAAVCDLATRFQTLYGGGYVLSAASKLLWVRHRWPVVILDGQAALCLRRLGCRFDVGDYRGYRREWRQQFAEREPVIRAACGELVGVKAFSLASTMSNGELEQLASASWFRERVFDKFLWWNSG